jgi:hypothetical protein
MRRGSVVDRDHVGPERDRNLAAIRCSPARTFCKTQATNQSDPSSIAPHQTAGSSQAEAIAHSSALERENRELRQAK